MLKVGYNFSTFDELSKCLEQFQKTQNVQLWVRDSRTVTAAAKRARRKSLNPALKYAELTYSCVFGGRRPSDVTKSHNQTSAGGCPFKVRLSTSNDGQALVVKEICHDHNHEPGKKLHEEPRRLYKNKGNSRGTGVRKPVRVVVNKAESRESFVRGILPVKYQAVSNASAARNARSSELQQHLRLNIEQRCMKPIQEVLDSPDHIDTPDHLSTPDPFTSLCIGKQGPIPYFPPTPVSPSGSSSSNSSVCHLANEYSSDEEEPCRATLVDLDVALEKSLGSLDNLDMTCVEDKVKLKPFGSDPLLSSGANCKDSSLNGLVNLLVDPVEEDPLPTDTCKKIKSHIRKTSPLALKPDGKGGASIPQLGIRFDDFLDFDVMLF